MYNIENTQTLFEELSTKVGGFSIYLGVMLFLNLFLFLLSLGFFLELFQLWIPNRYFELLDLIANFSGVISSFLIFTVLQKRYLQR